MTISTMVIWKGSEFINLKWKTYLIKKKLVKSTNLIESFFVSLNTMNYVKLFHSIYVMSMVLRAMRSINVGFSVFAGVM